jgi:uncharacterized RDD family membrane protein YckC
MADAPGVQPMLDTEREVPTPEGIELSVRLAGPVPRALAWLIDLFVRMAVFWSMSFVVQAWGKVGAGFMLIVWFALEWFYPTLCEVWWDGATPGKKALGLVVLQADGTPVRFAASLVRNLLRGVDFLPFFYGFGLLSMLMTRDFQRLGDIAAGTVVSYREGATKHGAIPQAAPAPPRKPLTLREQRLVLDLAARSPLLTTERAEELAALIPEVTGTERTDAALSRVLAIANYLVGRRT